MLCFYLAWGTVVFAEHDPTQPLDASTTTTRSHAAIDIQGIFISKGKRLALIDKKYYVVGDMTSQGLLVAILKDHVVIKQLKNLKTHFITQLDIRKK